MRMGPHSMMPRDTEAVKDASLARDTARAAGGNPNQAKSNFA